LDIDVIDQVLIRYSAIYRHCRGNGNTVGKFISQLSTLRMPIIQLGRQILFNNFIEFSVYMKLVRLLKTQGLFFSLPLRPATQPHI